jgi:hypothetical protein
MQILPHPNFSPLAVPRRTPHPYRGGGTATVAAVIAAPSRAACFQARQGAPAHCADKHSRQKRTRALERTNRTMYLRYVASTVEILPPQRDSNGRWLRGGRSTNAGGLSLEKRELIDLARERSPAALDKIFAIMNDETVPPAVQLAAAGMILDRGYGKPRQQSVEVEQQGRTLEDLLNAIWAEREAGAQTPG